MLLLNYETREFISRRNERITGRKNIMKKQNMQQTQEKSQGEKHTGMGMMEKKEHMRSMKKRGMGKKGRCPMCGSKHKGKMGPHRGKGPAQPNDEQIKAEIERVLTVDSWLDASSIHVSSENGIVTLVGTVDDWNSKRRAEDLALPVMGVNDVMNKLTVKRQES